MDRTLKHVTTALVAVALAVAPALALDKVQVNIKPKVVVQDELIRLDDVADVSGGAPWLVETIESTVVGTAPQLGKERIISTISLTNRLRRQKIDMDSLDIEAPRYVRVYREAQNVSEEKVRALIEQYLESTIPFEGGRLTVTRFSLRGEQAVPMGDTSYEIIPPRHPNLSGNNNFQVLVKVDGEVAAKLWATVDLEVVAPVVTALRSLPRGHVLTSTDLAVVEANIGSLGREPFMDSSQVVGKRLTRNLTQGEPILRAHLSEPVMVKRGSLVTVVVEEGALRISTRGIALENGGEGETIRVKNMSSQRTIFGKVVDSATVRVDL